MKEHPGGDYVFFRRSRVFYIETDRADPRREISV